MIYFIFNTISRPNASELDEDDAGGVHELNAKVAMQDALTRHWRFYAERHRDEHNGYYPFVYRASLDAQLRQDAEQGGR